MFGLLLTDSQLLWFEIQVPRLLARWQTEVVVGLLAMRGIWNPGLEPGGCHATQAVQPLTDSLPFYFLHLSLPCSCHFSLPPFWVRLRL